MFNEKILRKQTHFKYFKNEILILKDCEGLNKNHFYIVELLNKNKTVEFIKSFSNLLNAEKQYNFFIKKDTLKSIEHGMNNFL